ncbi:hypothetical protein F2P81_023023 [Scophthalmus maximus]|uniref:Uncharacterized protein n=1 Tax=Scophthalmus maximus TaxID=52904 RepID=A0A6A4RZ15_SCOMX|nr:hypothetical protein F2P81_023023 [Scophthalmus maximus]
MYLPKAAAPEDMNLSFLVLFSTILYLWWSVLCPLVATRSNYIPIVALDTLHKKNSGNRFQNKTFDEDRREITLFGKRQHEHKQYGANL